MTVRLGLIGDNIAQSQAPRLHELAGRLAGIPVSYERLVPRELGRDFEAVFAAARDGGFRGLNITYPYKERVVRLVGIPDSAGGGARRRQHRRLRRRRPRGLQHRLVRVHGRLSQRLRRAAAGTRSA